MGIKIGTREMKSVTVVDVSGRVTLGEGAGTLRETLRQMAISGHKKVLLNLAGVRYLDSSGIGVLVSSFATITSVGGQIKLVSLNKRMKDILSITKLCTVFETYDDETTALGSFVDLPAEAPASQR
ncbi:MAG TPA: STAS domain-containing protein [Candidatus Solibacter sp.]|nr:STAS domain-containing protein [Candidatus Solibacter sp.]